MPNAIGSRRGGFTLVELLVVLAIVGLLLSLILVAAADGVRRAEERATQSLIVKLETGLNERLDALLNTQPPINQTHRYLAAINFKDPNSGNFVPVGSTSSNSDDRRGQVIAQFDYLRAELPDVFFLNSSTSDGGTVATSYPLNFAAAPYPPGSNGLNNFVLPLGNTFPGLPQAIDNNGNPVLSPSAFSNYTPPPVSGMFGASFSAAGGIYKQLGADKAGYDGVDNNGNGFIDEVGEGGLSLNAVTTRLATHTHKTARSEMLYAVLTQGLGTLGSVFNPEEFTDREVKDTDGDGLLEFVDAWGEPLQFYRWPIYYGTRAASSDSQKGSAPYNNFTTPRQQDPLDPNQLLVAPGWWYSTANASLTSPVQGTFTAPGGGGTNQCSQGAMAFMHYFHLLVDPNFTAGNTVGTNWDRGGAFARRAYFSKFLILSGGPDREPGVAQFNKDYSDAAGGSTNIFTFPSTGASMEANALSLIYIENQASQSDPVRDNKYAFLEVPNTSTATYLYLQQNAGLDDISNHNVSAPTTGVR